MADIAGRDRGQIILVAAFALAVTFVALALLVNSAIFTENLASRGETAGSDDALSMRAMVEENVGHTVEAANRRNHSDGLQGAVERGVRNVSTQVALHHSTSGALVDVTYDDEREGVRIAQQSADPELFYPNSTGPDYVVATGVSRVGEPGGNGTRAFRINASEIMATDKTSAFEVKVNETGATGNQNSWRTRISNPSGTTVQINTTRNSGGSIHEEGCKVDASGSSAEIDLTEGTVSGRPCDALQTSSDGENLWFGSGASDEYNVTFRNADQIRGNFSMVVHDGEVPHLSGVESPDEPYHTEALYDVTVRYTYETSETRYGTDIRVAPGEPRA